MNHFPGVGSLVRVPVPPQSLNEREPQSGESLVYGIGSQLSVRKQVRSVTIKSLMPFLSTSYTTHDVCSVPLLGGSRSPFLRERCSHDPPLCRAAAVRQASTSAPKSVFFMIGECIIPEFNPLIMPYRDWRAGYGSANRRLCS
ncbi:MAG: hypothetical protein H6Q05_3817 [Acidobacteria bacterium]|nr:hypothetical protein [Acidobacteriota bacterium]